MECPTKNKKFFTLFQNYYLLYYFISFVQSLQCDCVYDVLAVEFEAIWQPNGV